MSKKNIQPNSAQPVIRTLVAKAALAELREENLTTDSSSLPAAADKGASPRALEFDDDGRRAEFLCSDGGLFGFGRERGRTSVDHPLCSYDGDDE